MKIFLICSKKFYDRVAEAKEVLESVGNEIILPNCYDDPGTEARTIEQGEEAHKEFKTRMYQLSREKINECDAVVVLNFDTVKNGVERKNYIGGATFLEMYDAYLLGKEIYLYNDIPECDFKDEIEGMGPVVLNGDLSLIQEAFGSTYAQFVKEVYPNIAEPTPMEMPELEQFMRKEDRKLTLERKEEDTE